MSLEHIAALIAAAGAAYGFLIAARTLQQGYFVKINIVTRQEVRRFSRESEPVRFWVIVGGVLALAMGMIYAAAGLWFGLSPNP